MAEDSSGNKEQGGCALFEGLCKTHAFGDPGCSLVSGSASEGSSVHKTFEQVWKREDNDAGSLLLASLDDVAKETNELRAKKGASSGWRDGSVVKEHRLIFQRTQAGFSALTW